MGKNSARRFLYLATMIVIVLILFLQNKYISVCLAIAFSLGAGVFLYKNITLLTDVSEDRVKTRTLKKSDSFLLGNGNNCSSRNCLNRKKSYLPNILNVCLRMPL